MESVLIRAITRAARAGTELNVTDGALLVRGTPPSDELLEHRDEVHALLLAEACVACGAPPWIREQDTALPWCRPCANRRGEQLLRAEHPELLTTKDAA